MQNHLKFLNMGYSRFSNFDQNASETLETNSAELHDLKLDPLQIPREKLQSIEEEWKTNNKRIVEKIALYKCDKLSKIIQQVDQILANPIANPLRFHDICQCIIDKIYDAEKAVQEIHLSEFLSCSQKFNDVLQQAQDVKRNLEERYYLFDQELDNNANGKVHIYKQQCF
uniref:Uncharacterized protein n=1 Tax=Panagrolaimus sp. ES5 TaxID=591445 RepID=A0AC34FFY8_9BILA